MKRGGRTGRWDFGRGPRTAGQPSQPLPLLGERPRGASPGVPAAPSPPSTLRASGPAPGRVGLRGSGGRRRLLLLLLRSAPGGTGPGGRAGGGAAPGGCPGAGGRGSGGRGRAGRARRLFGCLLSRGGQAETRVICFLWQGIKCSALTSRFQVLARPGPFLPPRPLPRPPPPRRQPRRAGRYIGGCPAARGGETLPGAAPRCRQRSRPGAEPLALGGPSRALPGGRGRDRAGGGGGGGAMGRAPPARLPAAPAGGLR